MPETLKPRLVLATGIAGTGKSTTFRELSELVSNTFVLDKDTINQALALSEEIPGKLPFGDFYHRYIDPKTYLLMAKIAAQNMLLGKIPLLDCMPVHKIQDGTMAEFLKQAAFGEFPRYLIHFVCKPEDCFNRLKERAKVYPEAAVRDQDKITSYGRFLRFLESKQPMIPSELTRHKHLIINTSLLDPKKSAHLCLEYISSDMNGRF